MNKKPLAVLLDYDGTLADSAHDNFLGWSFAFGSLNIKIDKHDYLLREGFKLQSIAEYFLTKGGVTLDKAQEIVALRERYAREKVQQKLYPYTMKVVLELKKRGYKLALATTASRERIQHPNLAVLKQNLDALVCGDDLKEGKPSPEAYLTAALRLGVAPAECWVIENAPAGIESAKRAGMYCLAVCSTLEPQYLSQADRILKDLEQCLDYL